MIQASELFALSQGSKCTGDDTCHWCGTPCHKLLPHDDVQYTLPVKHRREPTKRPGNGFICWGCWLWRRKRTTINYFSGEFLDGKCAEDFSWLITERGAWALRNNDYPQLIEFLRNPTGSFALSLVSSGQGKNYLQLNVGNDLSNIDLDTLISFTINNVPYQYTIYELEEAIQNGTQGKSPGVKRLLDLYHPPKPTNGKPEEKRGRGRPRKEEEVDGRIVKRSIFRSGGDT